MQWEKKNSFVDIYYVRNYMEIIKPRSTQKTVKKKLVSSWNERKKNLFDTRFLGTTDFFLSLSLPPSLSFSPEGNCRGEITITQAAAAAQYLSSMIDSSSGGSKTVEVRIIGVRLFSPLID